MNTVVTILVGALPVLLLACSPSDDEIGRVVDARVSTALAQVPTETLAPTVTPVPILPTVRPITLPPTPTPQPTATPQSTAAPRPTHTPLPTQAPLPTVVPLPTLVPLPTYTLVPTHTPLPTSAPAPTYTPYPTFTPLPTLRPLPTYTPLPTPTSTPVPVPLAEFGDGFFRVGIDILPGTYRTTDASRCYWARLSNFGGTSDIIANENISAGPAIVTISPTDVGFESSRCGTWHRIGN